MQTQEKPARQEKLLVPKDDAQKSVSGEASTRQKRQSVIEPWWRGTLAILPIFLLTRFVFLLLTYLGGVLFTLPNYSLRALSLHALLKGWYHWDAVRYATIASKGYVSLEYAAFFPLYPWVERVVSLVLHKDVFLVGMLISNIAFLGALIVLYRLVETEFDVETAKRTALYLVVFPTALFFFTAYNESLFLFFALLSFYAMRRGSWWLAGVFGGLATLTRLTGLLLLAVFLYEFVRQAAPQLRVAWHEQRWWHGLRLLSGLLAAPLIPLGLAIYAYYLNLRFHDPLAFSHAQVHWRIGPTAPWYTLDIAIRSMLTLSPFTFTTAHNIIDMTALILFLTLLILGFVGPERFARSQWSMLLFGLIALLYPLFFPGLAYAPGIAYDPLPSTQRFVLEIFPGFILLARLGRRPWFHQGFLVLALPMLAFFVLQFITGHWTV